MVNEQVGVPAHRRRQSHIDRVDKVHAEHALKFRRQVADLFFPGFYVDQGYPDDVAALVHDGEALVVGIPGQLRVVIVGGLLGVPGAAAEYFFAFPGLQILFPHDPAAQMVAYPGNSGTVGAQVCLAERQFFLVFNGNQRARVRCARHLGFVAVTFGEIINQRFRRPAVSVAQHVQKTCVDAAVDAGEIQEVADGAAAEMQADVIPESMAGEARMFLGEFVEGTVAARLHQVAQLVVQFGAPFFAAVGGQAFGIPAGQVEQHGILHDFLQIGPEQHRIEQYACRTFPDLCTQVVVVAVEINEHLVAHHLGFAGAQLKQFRFADIALFQVAEVTEYQHFDFFSRLVLQHLLDGHKIEFRRLQCRLSHIAGIAVPVGHEIGRFIQHPLVDLTAVLHAVFPERSLGSGLRSQFAGQQDAGPTKQQYLKNTGKAVTWNRCCHSQAFRTE